MIEVKFFGTARVKFQVRSIEVEANDVKELISVVAERFCIREKEVKQFLIQWLNLLLVNVQWFKMVTGHVVKYQKLMEIQLKKKI